MLPTGKEATVDGAVPVARIVGLALQERAGFRRARRTDIQVKRSEGGSARSRNLSMINIARKPFQML
jgi:hypothetical protein